MKKILTWVSIAAILSVDGFMQDQSDTSVSMLGEHMDAIEKKLKDDATALAAVADQTQMIADLTSRAETAEAALVEAGRQHDATKALLVTATADLTTRTQELAAANVKIAKRPPTETRMIPGEGADKKVKANEMTFQQELYGKLKQYGTTPKKTTT